MNPAGKVLGDMRKQIELGNGSSQIQICFGDKNREHFFVIELS
jgi:hypothetical protein